MRIGMLDSQPHQLTLGKTLMHNAGTVPQRHFPPGFTFKIIAKMFIGRE